MYSYARIVYRRRWRPSGWRPSGLTRTGARASSCPISRAAGPILPSRRRTAGELFQRAGLSQPRKRRRRHPHPGQSPYRPRRPMWSGRRTAPGRSGQNRAHERMHRILKAEAARPPAHHQSAQQARCERCCRESNAERSHEALDHRTPAAVDQPSTRPILRSSLRRLTQATTWCDGGATPAPCASRRASSLFAIRCSRRTSPWRRPQMASGPSTFPTSCWPGSMRETSGSRPAKVSSTFPVYSVTDVPGCHTLYDVMPCDGP